MVLFLRWGLTAGPHLLANKEETDANIRKVHNGNHMLEFVANQPFQNMFPKYMFLVYSHGLYLGFVVRIQVVESMLPIVVLNFISGTLSQRM